MVGSQKTKNRTNVWHSNSTTEHISGKRKTLIWKDACTAKFIAALFTIPKIRKEAKAIMSLQMWYACVMEYYSAIERDEILPSVQCGRTREYYA